VGIARLIWRPVRLHLEAQHWRVPLDGTAKVGDVGSNVVETREHASSIAADGSKSSCRSCRTPPGERLPPHRQRERQRPTSKVSPNFSLTLTPALTWAGNPVQVPGVPDPALRPCLERPPGLPIQRCGTLGGATRWDRLSTLNSSAGPRNGRSVRPARSLAATYAPIGRAVWARAQVVLARGSVPLSPARTDPDRFRATVNRRYSG
jgi:hypothetical protein